ncbi:hypothetical protein MRB53_036343 [Persea americana]|nr:hypothetical protein MRB53_036343 [Persea americana]
MEPLLNLRLSQVALSLLNKLGESCHNRSIRNLPLPAKVSSRSEGLPVEAKPERSSFVVVVFESSLTSRLLTFMTSIPSLTSLAGIFLYKILTAKPVKPLAEHFSNWLPHLLISTFKASLAYSIRRIHRAEQSTSGALATGYCYRPPRVALVMLTLLHGRRLSLLRERRKEGGRTKVGFDAKLGVGRVGSLRLLGIWSSGRPTELTEMGPRIPGPDPELSTVDPDLISSGGSFH